MDRTAQDGPGDQDRWRFAFAHPGQLWMSNAMHGPSVMLSGPRVRGKSVMGRRRLRRAEV
ncbi:hypothetical protein [Azohydromonas australica]|uniref:hypothetical protein n=1 Tax=Azohydromonas australica TaxID=364039 RepID=UPI00146BBE27|nr:hypothetical protein [Azohydromonas australica]